MNFFTKAVSVSLFLIFLSFIKLQAQFSFTNSNDQLQGVTHSGCSVTVVDVNNDGLDDIVRLEQGHIVYIDYQQPGQKFTHNLIGDFGNNSGWAWGMCAGDFDHNGFKDIIAGGGGPAVSILMVDSTGLGGTVVALPSSNFFVQNINVMDVNNDGWEDLFCCDDDHESHIWTNDGAGNLSESSIINFNVTNTDDSGNYGSVWTDFDNDGDVDFYIAKCRQFINNKTDGRRIDVLFVNNGDGTFTSDAAAYGLADSDQTWTCNFADIDNDGDLDATQVDYNVTPKLLENDGTGHMTNISSGSGFSINVYPIESEMEDFDNDGFVDILVTGDTYQLFHNNGDKTFTKIDNVFGAGAMESFATGDLNHDGKVDVYASYANIYTTPTNQDDVLWLNTISNGNHFITFNLIGSDATPASYGARVTLYGSWGKQVREVHAGESYGTCNSTNLHFGLGAATSIDSAVINWPSGTKKTIVNPAIDQFMTVKENSCVSPDFSISASEPLIFCPGDSTTLNAPDLTNGYSYLWSDGSTSQVINPTTTGNYYCTAVSANDDCSVTSTPLSVVVNPPSVPTVTASGDLTFCQGGSVTLTSSSADSYMWSNGSNTQSIQTSESGSYSVSVPGMCQDWQSDPVTVTVLSSPAPTTTDAYIGAPGNATVTATGTDIEWYTDAIGGSPIWYGDSYTTYASGDETFYAEDRQTYSGDSMHGGEFSHTGSSLYSGNTTNNFLIFDVQQNCTLLSAKVYTDVAGERLITLRDQNGVLINSALVNIPVDTSRVILNFPLTPGTAYQLGTDTAQNFVLLGYNSPRLQRSNSEVYYPYAISDLLSIDSSQAGSSYYYYFYDWEVKAEPSICVSERTPATIYLATGITDPPTNDLLQIFPNPSPGLITVKCNEAINNKVAIQLVDVAGRILISKDEESLRPNEEVNFDLSSFAKGVYFIKVKSDEINVQRKVVIE